MFLASLLLSAIIPFQAIPLEGGGHSSAPAAAEAERPAISFAPIPSDAVVLAASDIVAVPHFSQPWMRYVWTRNADPSRVAAVKVAIQSAVSRTRRIIPLRTVSGGRLVALDLYELAGKNLETARELAKLWDRLAECDQMFYFAADKGDVVFIERVVEVPVETKTESFEWVKKKIPPYRANDGKTYDWMWEKKTTTKLDVRIERKVIREAVQSSGKEIGFGPHIYAERNGIKESPEQPFYTSLVALCGTRTPVVDYQHFCSQVLSTLDDGLYYEFAGIKASPDAKLTDFEFWLKDHFGANVEDVKRLQVETKAAHFTSGVTGGPRGVRVVRGLVGWVVWTEDLKRGNVDPNADPVESVENPKGFDAIEAIGVNRRGQFETAIFDGKGKLAEVVPPDVATDFTIPDGFGQELAPWLSCAKCHAAAEGFRSTRNPLYESLSKTHGPLKPDIFAKDPEEAERLAILLQPIEQDIIQARSDLADGVFLASGGYRFSEVADELRQIENDYRYARVDPVRACAELGYDVPDAKAAVALLRAMLPGIEGEREAIDLIALKAGESVAVRKFRAQYISAAYRVRQNGR